MSATVAQLGSNARLAACSVEEQRLRVQLAAAYRIVEHLGWTELIYGHLTVRVPGPEKHFLINPYGLGYDEVTASKLVKIDVDGNVVGPGEFAVNPAGFVIHSAIHIGRDDAHCVMHTHTRAGMALAASEAGLLPVSMFATAFYNRIAYHDYEGVTTDLAERERLVRDLGPHNAMILKNHGLLSVGRTIPEAFLHLYRLERAAQVQLDAQAVDHRLSIIPPGVAERSARQENDFGQLEGSGGFGELEFGYLMRKMDRIDSSYRQ